MKIIGAFDGSLKRVKQRVSDLEERSEDNVDSKDKNMMESDLERICNDITKI